MYVEAMVASFVVITALGVVYERGRSARDAGAAATMDASFGADRAARRIDLDLGSITTMLSGLAANPQIPALFADPAGCTLDFSGSEAFSSGHLDVVAADGAVACSSLRGPLAGGYPGAAWIPAALDRPTISAPVADGRTGKRVVVASAPIPGRGLVAAFLDLDALGPDLLSNLGGPRGLEFLVVAGDGTQAVSRSIDPQKWVGAPLDGTAFAASPQGSPRRDVDGTSRFYASAPVETTGWRVYAGADRSQALAMANEVHRGDLVVASVLLAVVIATGIVLSRRISGPIVALSEQVRAPFTASTREPLPVQGPREVAELAGHLNQLRESLRHELDVTARSAAIVESSNDSIISWTPLGIITTWNSRSEEMYGYRAEDALGQDMSLIVPAAWIAELTRLHEQVLRGEPVEPVETQKVRRDGTLIDVSVTLSPIRDRTGAVVGLSAVGRDITERKRHDAELRRTLSLLAATLDATADGIFVSDLDGEAINFNTTFADMWRMPESYRAAPDMAEGMDLAMQQLEDPEAFVATTGEVFARPDADYHDTVLFKDGQILERTSRPQWVDGAIVGRVWSFHDVTERNRLEAQLAEARDKAVESSRLEHQSQRLESLGQLAGGVAHDFNNLLAVIMNYATFVAEAVPDDDDVQFDIEQILSASERAAGLTRQLLMFARREPVRPETLDLNAVVENVRGLLARSIGEQIVLVVNEGVGLPAIVADRGQTEQILLNLAVNARDAMVDGGNLLIETAVVEIDQEYVHLHPGAVPGRYVQLSVSDNGTGMSRDVAARAFEPFFTTKAKLEGSGLGLATVYGILAEAGGMVGIYSEEGLGTTVRVYFPAATDPATPVTAGPRAMPIPGHGETILVVEDQDAVRAVTVRILRRNGYFVLEAASGADAIDIAETSSVDLLLTDVVMPNMAGHQLAEVLRADHPALPVLFMSGYAETLLGPQRALDEAVTLIQKPFNEVRLLEGVHRAITAAAVTVPR